MIDSKELMELARDVRFAWDELARKPYSDAFITLLDNAASSLETAAEELGMLEDSSDDRRDG